MEDDVFLQPYAPTVLKELYEEISSGKLPFVAGTRCLLRLGWALSVEHRADMAFHFAEVVRMSNPCHALTRAYAAALIERDRGIIHTVDEYIHRIAPEQGEAWTVFPPLAADLSWSVGAFDSTIHPKAIRSDWLRERGDELAAALHKERVARHVKKKHFLVIGPPGGAEA
jgi:hypothetical protein